MKPVTKISNGLEAFLIANKNIWKNPGGKLYEIKQNLASHASSWLQRAHHQGEVQRYKIDSVEADVSGFIQTKVHKDIKPGDAYSSTEEFKGIVLSVDDDQNAVIMSSTNAEPTTFKIRVSIQPNASVDYVMIDLKV
jgi:hypothetical protein